MQATQFKTEIGGLSERSVIRLFEMKWDKEDLFSVNVMLTIAEDILSSAAYLRFKKLYQRLSAEGFSSEEKTAVNNIRSCEREIEALKQFFKRENESN
jgi:hypothetical protein